MNLEMNWPPLSLIIFFGSPYFLKISQRKITATPELVILVVHGTRIFILVRYSVTTKITLNPFDSGKGPIISTDIVSHGLVAMSVGYRGAWGLFQCILSFGKFHILRCMFEHLY